MKAELHQILDDENKKLKKYLEVSEKCCAEYKQENEQLHDLTKKIVGEIKRYDLSVNKQKVSYTEYVIGLFECLDTILKKYGGG